MCLASSETCCACCPLRSTYPSVCHPHCFVLLCYVACLVAACIIYLDLPQPALRRGADQYASMKGPPRERKSISTIHSYLNPAQVSHSSSGLKAFPNVEKADILCKYNVGNGNWVRAMDSVTYSGENFLLCSTNNATFNGTVTQKTFLRYGRISNYIFSLRTKILIEEGASERSIEWENVYLWTVYSILILRHCMCLWLILPW